MSDIVAERCRRVNAPKGTPAFYAGKGWQGTLF